MAKDNSNNPDDEGSSATKEAEAKENSLASYFTSLKLGYGILGASLKSREGDRAATQSARPMKDMPVDYLSAGSGKDPSLSGGSSGSSSTTTDDTDTSSGSGDNTGDTAGSGDTGSTGGSSSGDTGGGPSIAPAPDSGYVSFADTASVSQQDAKAIAKTKTVDPSIEQAEKSEVKQTAKDQQAKGPTVTSPGQTGPGGKGGGTGGPGAGPGSGGKGSGGAAPSVGL